MVIDIQCGAALKPRDDVMLHVSLRPQDNVIVRNHFKDQAWGAEERHGGNPIQPHQSFEIAITAEHSMYRIAVNGQHFCTFNHRLPLNLARFISISGTCTVSYITIDNMGPIATPAYPPIQVHHPNPHTPVHIHRPPVHIHHHHPPAPPPMPAMPPPYPGTSDVNLECEFSVLIICFPGFYPSHQHATPYTVFKHELQDKLNHLKHHD